MADDVVQQLESSGYFIIDCLEHLEALSDSSDILNRWFEHTPEQQKLVQTGTTSTTGVAADAGRGYLRLPAKDMLEVKAGWKCASAPAELRLAANTVLRHLRDSSRTALQHVLSSSAVSGTQQMLQELLGDLPASTQQQKISGSDGSSVLHINRYTPSPAAAAAKDCRLQGNEAHVDKGLLTVIWATQPGLQVLSRDGSWVPIAPGPHQLVILVGHTLSFLTAGRIPAAMHRVVVLDSSDGGTQESARLSLCFKLRAAPEAVLSPAALKPASAGPVGARYQVCKTVKQLMEEFDASHTSLHAQQQQLLLHPSAAAAAAAGGAVVKREASNSPDHAAKRPCQQPVAAITQEKATPDAPQRQQQQESAPTGHITVTFVHVYNRNIPDISFHVRPTARWRHLLVAHKQAMHRRGFLPQVDDFPYRHIFDGVRIDPDETLVDVGFADGDAVLVLKEQLGD